MLQIALTFLFIAQLIHFSRYWCAISAELYAEYSEKRLKSHLDWSRNSRGEIYGDTRPGSAMRRA